MHLIANARAKVRVHGGAERTHRYWLADESTVNAFDASGQTNKTGRPGLVGMAAIRSIICRPAGRSRLVPSSHRIIEIFGDVQSLPAGGVEDTMDVGAIECRSWL